MLVRVHYNWLFVKCWDRMNITDARKKTACDFLEANHHQHGISVRRQQFSPDCTSGKIEALLPILRLSSPTLSGKAINKKRNSQKQAVSVKKQQLTSTFCSLHAHHMNSVYFTVVLNLYTGGGSHEKVRDV